ncbi:hypothetical protein CBER1_06936 [Cercospora berteroae]|uniref:SnoaL-like domain-containing protein n=1 Tax=Cercospora berteroae TaxID=357750 RepID=A0A2S6C424_9PEZI|nr:hypothetical protein CBER1_06936 [Cercospora berteroae]
MTATTPGSPTGAQPKCKTQTANGEETSQNEQPIHIRIEQIIRAAFHAINERDFAPTSEPWHSSFSPNFADDCSGISHDARVYIAKQYPGDISDLDIELHVSKLVTNLQAFLHVEQLLSNACPEYRYEVGEEMQVSVIRKAKYASVIAHVHMLGLPPGTRRPSVTLFEFERDADGGWLCVRSKNMPGLHQMD